VTIPLRIGVSVWLIVRTRWRALAAWLLTWAVAELVLAGAKAFFHRGRPPGPLVDVSGTFSFPSGHAVAGAATAVALVLVLLPAGPKRRRWELAAVAFAFVMALSRVYLQAHWFSDVVAGVLLGAGVALGSAGLVTEIRDITLRRRARAPTGTT
jgi:undecaprenyl-diphosphatase